MSERNELVSFMIRLVVNPSLQASLNVDGGRRWVDPSGGDQDQRSKKPKKYNGDEQHKIKDLKSLVRGRDLTGLVAV